MLCLAAVAAVLVLGAERPAEASPYAAAAAAQDTLRYAAVAGRPLIVGLPARYQGAPARYELVEAPALSWLVDRSFLWSTQPGERGALPIKIRRTAPGALPDTLVLIVDLAG